jgi:hypothetical protein
MGFLGHFLIVIPAQAGIQVSFSVLMSLDTRFRGYDGFALTPALHHTDSPGTVFLKETSPELNY